MKSGSLNLLESSRPVQGLLYLCIVLQNVKGKLTLEQGTKAQRGSRGIVILFLLSRRKMGVGGQHHTPAALPPVKTRYSLYRRLGGPQGW